MVYGSSRSGPSWASARMMVVGSPQHTSMREGAASVWWGKLEGWPSRPAVRSSRPSMSMAFRTA